MRLGFICAGLAFAGGALAADVQSAFVSVDLSAFTVPMSHPAAHQQIYLNYGLWSVRVEASSYHLITETCDFEIGEMPPYSTLQGPGDARFDGDTKFRYGIAMGGAERLLSKGLTHGTVPLVKDDKWSDFAVTRNAFEKDYAAIDYNFAGVLQNPKPIAVAKSVAAVQPVCDSLHASSTILFGRMHDSGGQPSKIVVEVLENYDAAEPLGANTKFEHLQDGFYIAVLRKDQFKPDASNNVARALVKAGESNSP